MIKIFSRVLAQCLIGVAVSSCVNDDSVGNAVMPDGDEIIHKADTFHVKSVDVYDNVMSAQADSMYFGEFYSPVYGTTKAELLVQVAAPEKYEFPGNELKPEPDSLVLMMYYKSWYGASNTPLEISVYELNKKDIDYATQYMSDLNVEDYTDQSVLMGKKMVTSIDLTLPDSIREAEGFVPSVQYKFDDTQLQRFWNIAKAPYPTIEDFVKEFKGMYITSKYGASTVFNFFQIDLKLFYHYTYQKNGKDTIVNTTITYPANKEVRQLNKFSHEDMSEVVEPIDSINYIKASAGIYTKLNLPIGRIAKKMRDSVGNKDLHISGASLYVELADMEENTLDLSPPDALMAITAGDEYEEFLKTYDVPTTVDTTKVIAYFASNVNAYNIDISYYLIKHIRALMNGEVDENEEIELLLLPVELKQEVSASTGNTIVTRVRPQAKVGGVRVRSGNNASSPMRIRVLYAGF